MLENILTPEMVAGIREQYTANNPIVLYPFWQVGNWPATDSIQNAFYRFIATQDQQHLDTALSFSFPLSGESTQRETAIPGLVTVAAMRPFMSAARFSEYELQIRNMMNEDIKRMRAWDADERLTRLAAALLTDGLLGTDYFHAGSPGNPNAVEWETMQQQYDMQLAAMVADWKDGLTSESRGYMINTQKLNLLACGALGKNWLPGMEEWLPKFAEYLQWETSYDGKAHADWGDSQSTDNGLWGQILWYKVPLMWQLIGLDVMPNEMAHLSMRLLELRRGVTQINAPGDIHLINTMNGYYMLDPRKLPAQSNYQPVTGTKYWHPGVQISHTENASAFVVGTAPIMDDHDFYSGGGHYRVYIAGELVVDQPMGYAVNWKEFNAGAIDGHGWFADRKCVDHFIEPDGTIVFKYQQKGPMPTPHWEDPPAYDYQNAVWLRTIRINLGALTVSVQDDVTTDGVFPDEVAFPASYQYRIGAAVFECKNNMRGVNAPEQNAGTFLYVTPETNRQMQLIVSGHDEIIMEHKAYGWSYKVYDVAGCRLLSNSGSILTEIEIGPVVTVPPPPPVELPEYQVVQYVNNTDIGYAIIPDDGTTWIRHPGQGVNNEVDYAMKGDGSVKASWSAKVIKGRYRVSTTWYEYINRATNSPYKIFVNDVEKASLRVNQELAPAGLADNGALWFDLPLVDVTDDTAIMRVELSNDADEFVIADAVRIERIGDVPVVVDPEPVRVYVLAGVEVRAYSDRCTIGPQEFPRV